MFQGHKEQQELKPPQVIKSSLSSPQASIYTHTSPIQTHEMLIMLLKPKPSISPEISTVLSFCLHWRRWENAAFTGETKAKQRPGPVLWLVCVYVCVTEVMSFYNTWSVFTESEFVSSVCWFELLAEQPVVLRSLVCWLNSDTQVEPFRVSEHPPGTEYGSLNQASQQWI